MVQPGKKIRLLIVDDSIVYREVLSRGISTDPGIEIAATARDPFDARDKILEFAPDVMTCDVEMPKMNGIEFIKRLLPQYPLPVIVVSSVSSAVFDAMNAGAVDFVTKPDLRSAKGVESFINEMIVKVKIAANARILAHRTGGMIHKAAGSGFSCSMADTESLIAIGASTGGTEAIHNLLKHFSADMPGIVVVQHIPPDFSRMFAERLNTSLPLKVSEAKNGDYVERGAVLVAPGDKHMKVKKTAGRYRIECFGGDKVNGHCPSVDVLFESVAAEAGAKAIGIILTGMGYDGAKGLLSMRNKGARTIGQDEGSCVVYGMPKVAYNIGAVEKQVPLDRIPGLVNAYLNQGEK